MSYNEKHISAIEKYIERTPRPNRQHYQATYSELVALADFSRRDTTRALWLAYDYGMAKGYRAAQKLAHGR